MNYGLRKNINKIYINLIFLYNSLQITFNSVWAHMFKFFVYRVPVYLLFYYNIQHSSSNFLKCLVVDLVVLLIVATCRKSDLNYIDFLKTTVEQNGYKI